jgi:hypothetical protein
MSTRFLIRPVTDVLKLLLTPKEAARALSISERTLWGLTAPRGPIPVLRLPGRGSKARALRYPIADLQRWIDQQQTATPPADTDGAL